MTPVYQTVFSDEEKGIHGNCFVACLASLFDLTIDEVPRLNECEDSKWVPPFQRFLYNIGYTFEGSPDYNPQTPYAGVGGYVIVGGQSPRKSTRGHSVIYKDGIMIHDPHPDNTGLVKTKEVYLIEKKPLYQG